jgi:hypothetical protein
MVPGGPRSDTKTRGAGPKRRSPRLLLRRRSLIAISISAVTGEEIAAVLLLMAMAAQGRVLEQYGKEDIIGT